MVVVYQIEEFEITPPFLLVVTQPMDLMQKNKVVARNVMLRPITMEGRVSPRQVRSPPPEDRDASMHPGVLKNL